jgi:hypothetical protein
MENKDNSNMVIIDDKEYKIEDFNKEQTYHITQIRDLQAKAADLRFKLDQLTTAEKAFTSLLVKSLTEEEKPKDEE